MAETCMNKYVQTLSHSSQQKIRNTTGEKKKGNERGKNAPLAHIMHAPKSHPIEVTKDLIECMIIGFNQKHFQK